MTDAVVNTIISKLKEQIEQLKSPRVRAVENGMLDIEWVTYKDMVLQQIQDANARNQVDGMFDNPDLINTVLTILATAITSKAIDSGQQVAPNKIRVMKFSLYKLTRLKMLLHCIPVDGDCPQTPIELIQKIVSSYADNKDVIMAVARAIAESVKNEELKKEIAELFNASK